MMPLQRTCVGESQVRNKLSNGPLRAQSNVSDHKVFCDVKADVICRGYAGILTSARSYVNQGGTADSLYSSLIELFSIEDVFLSSIEDR